MRISKAKFETILLMLFALSFYYIGYFLLSSSETQLSYSLVIVFSWIGILAFVFCVINFRKITGKWFTLYTIYFIFLCLFMFGQCFMWAFGIHDSEEIGRVNLFHFGFPATTKGILLAQLLSILGIIMFHCGFCLFYKKNRNVKESELNLPSDSSLDHNEFIKKTNYSDENALTNISSVSFQAGFDQTLKPIEYKDNDLFVVSCIACLFGSIATFYSIARAIVVNQVYGYGATLYNAEVVASQSNIILLLRMLFFPSLVGILIGSSFSYKSRRFVYVIFAVFSFASLMAGDRGEWIFPLVLLFWLHHNYVRPINLRKFFMYVALGVLLIFVSVAVRNVRLNGVTISKLFDSMFSGDNAIFSAFFELGRGMQHSVIMMEVGWDSYPYGNTYLLALLGMVTEAVPRFLIPGYSSLATWYSTKFLSISYGAGFSIIAEGIVNFGPLFFWIPLFIFGFLFARILFGEKSKLSINNALSLFMKTSITYCALQGIRNTALVSLKTFVFSTALIIIAVYVFKSIRKNRSIINT